MSNTGRGEHQPFNSLNGRDTSIMLFNSHVRSHEQARIQAQMCITLPCSCFEADTHVRC